MEASNLQELKDAAIELMKFTCNSCEQRFCEEDIEEEDGQRVSSPCSAIIRMRNALSANPICNCNVGSAQEQIKRFEKFCQEHHEYWRPDKSLTAIQRCNCPCYEKNGCNYFIWAQMPYEEGGVK